MNDTKRFEHQPRPESARSDHASAIAIENIGQMRRREGIDDCELEDEIRQLHVGDIVRLTLRASDRAVESVLVRVTTVHEQQFTGAFATPPADSRLQRLTDGMTLSFTADHIHSIHKTQDSETARAR